LHEKADSCFDQFVREASLAQIVAPDAGLDQVGRQAEEGRTGEPVLGAEHEDFVASDGVVVRRHWLVDSLRIEVIRVAEGPSAGGAHDEDPGCVGS
jgi:hypothetical protein